MAKNIPIDPNLNQVDLNEQIGAIRGVRTDSVIAWYKVAKSNLESADILLNNNGNIPHVIFLFSNV